MGRIEIPSVLIESKDEVMKMGSPVYCLGNILGILFRSNFWGCFSEQLGKCPKNTSTRNSTTLNSHLWPQNTLKIVENTKNGLTTLNLNTNQMSFFVK